MRLVIDTSVLIAVVANGPTKSHLVELTRDKELIAPPSVHWEIGNAFSALLKRKRLRLSQVRAALAAYADIAIRFVDVELLDAMELVEHLGVYAYDAYVIACARQQRCALLALDRGLVDGARRAGVAVLEG